MRQIAHGLQVVPEPGEHRHQRHLDELRAVVHHALEIAHIDTSVPRHYDTDVEALSLERIEVDERAVEMERVGDYVAALRGPSQTVDDQVLARGRARDVADLGWLAMMSAANSALMSIRCHSSPSGRDRARAYCWTFSADAMDIGWM